MTKTIVYCDICKKEPAHTLSIGTGSYIDAAGDQDMYTSNIDLCAEHLKKAFDLSTVLLSCSQRATLSKNLKSLVKK